MKILIQHLFPAQFSNTRKNWERNLNHPRFKLQVIISGIILFFLAKVIPDFFNYIQTLHGHRIDDFILNLLPPHNLSLSIFVLLYAVIFLSVINLSPDPITFLKCIQAYCLLVMIRIFCMYFIHLEPSPSIIPLDDALIGQTFYNGSVITKDLFFSGHVSTMTLFSIAIPFRFLRFFFITATVLVAVFLLIQHVHYTIDVVAAPVFSWLCYSIACRYGLK